MTFHGVRVGLCLRCVHHRVTGNRRGSQFHLCGLAATDARFRKYPRLPVLLCEGFEEDHRPPAEESQPDAHE